MSNLATSSKISMHRSCATSSLTSSWSGFISDTRGQRKGHFELQSLHQFTVKFSFQNLMTQLWPDCKGMMFFLFHKSSLKKCNGSANDQFDLFIWCAYWNLQCSILNWHLLEHLYLYTQKKILYFWIILIFQCFWYGRSSHEMQIFVKCSTDIQNMLVSLLLMLENIQQWGTLPGRSISAKLKTLNNFISTRAIDQFSCDF